jgi:flagellar protein FliL
MKYLILTLFIALAQPLHANPNQAKAIYHYMGPPLVVNLSDEGRRQRFMQIKVTVMSRDQKMIDMIKANDPALRHTLLMLLSHRSSSEMSSVQYREELRKDALMRLRMKLIELTGITNADALDQLLFTEFVIQ